MFPVQTIYRTQKYNKTISNAKLHVQIKKGYCKGNKGVFTPIALELGYYKSCMHVILTHNCQDFL